MAEVTAELRFIRLRKLIDEGKEREMKETVRQRKEVERKITKVEKEIKVKEKELKELMKDVEVMEQDLIEQIVIMEKGGLDEEERARAVEKLKADEMRKLDWEINIDERRDMVGKSKKQKEDLERDVLIINEYIQKYREEEKETEKRKRCDNDDR